VPGISETSINTWARYQFDIGTNLSGFIRAEYYYESDTQVISNVPQDVMCRKTLRHVRSARSMRASGSAG
jgi:hypothetical protein